MRRSDICEQGGVIFVSSRSIYEQSVIFVNSRDICEQGGVILVNSRDICECNRALDSRYKSLCVGVIKGEV